MQALAITDPNDHSPLALKLITVPNPVCESGQVSIKTAAISVDPIDDYLLQHSSPLWTYPHIPGTAVAGTILEVGENVAEFQVGQRVVAITDSRRNGTFSGQVVIDARLVAPIPAALSFTNAAVLAGSPLLAYSALLRKANLKGHKTILIQHGNNAMGVVAIQLAKTLGLTVYTTAPTNQVAFLAQFKPDYIIDYQTDNIVTRVRALTLGQGVDLTLISDADTPAPGNVNLLLATNGQILWCSPQTPTDIDLVSRSLTLSIINFSSVFNGPTVNQRSDLAKMLSELAEYVVENKVHLYLPHIARFDEIPAFLMAMHQRQLDAEIVATGPNIETPA